MKNIIKIGLVVSVLSSTSVMANDAQASFVKPPIKLDLQSIMIKMGLIKEPVIKEDKASKAEQAAFVKPKTKL